MVDEVKTAHPGKFVVSFRPREQQLDELAADGIASHGVVCLDRAGGSL